MLNGPRSLLLRYGVALVSAGLALLLRGLLTPLWGNELPFLTLFPAVLLSAWYGGLGPGLVTTALCAAGAGYFWLVPSADLGASRLAGWVGLALAVLVMLLIAWLTAALRRSQDGERAQREYFQVTLASIGDAVIVTNPQGKVTFLNRVAEEVTGWTSADALGKSLSEVFPIVNEETRQAVEDPVAKVLRTGAVAGLANHTILCTKDGRELPIDDSAAPIRDAAGRLQGIVLVFREISERKLMEEALRHSESRYRTISELVSDYAYAVRIEPSGRAVLEWVTEAFSRISGFTAPELEARGGLAGLIHPEDRPSVWQRLQALFAGQPGSSEHRIITKTGEVRWLQDYSRPEWDADQGRVVRIIGAGQDITARKQAEEASLRLAAIVESSDDAIISKSLEGVVTSWNAAAERIFGYLAEEMIGQPILRLLPDDRQDEERLILERLRRGEHVDHFETVRRTKDGRLLDVSVTTSPIRDERGRIIGASKIARDITARKQAEEALAQRTAALQRSQAAERAQREFFQVTLASIGDAVIVTNPHGEVTFLNRVAEDVTGWSTTEAAGKPLPEVFHIQHEETRQPVENPVAKVLRTGGITGLANHTILVRKDGSRCPIDDSAAPIRDEQGRLLGIILVFRDITVRKRAEEAQAQLLTKVQSANEELQQFAYIVSHDLSEPLRTVANYVELLARRYRGKLDTGADQYLTFAVDGAKRMQQMIAALLAYTRAGGQLLEFTAVDCEALLTQVVSDLQVAFSEQHATLTHDPLPTVVGDATRLKQVLQNLISNALKFSREVPPHVHITAQRLDGQWQFAVRDNGIGIDPQQVGQLFQVFQRLHPRGEYPGTGIGLAICKKIVEQHGGRIWVESRPGEGSTFYFTIRS